MFQVFGAVGNNRENRAEDVFAVKEALSDFGFFDFGSNKAEPHGIFTRELYEGIKDFQFQNGLRVDGILKPKGETESAISRMFEKIGQRPNRRVFVPEKPSEFDATGRMIRGDRRRLVTLPIKDYRPKPFGEEAIKKKLLERQIRLAAAAPIPQEKPEQQSEEESKPLELDETDRMIRPQPDTAEVLQEKPDFSEVIKKRNKVVNIPQHGPDPVFDHFRENLKPREGGIADRSKEVDLGGLTNQGMSQAFLDDLKKRSPEWNLPEKSTDLTDQQISDIFREEFYERTKIGKLNEIAGFDKTGSKLVEHVFDAGIMTNPKRVGQWLQQSIDEVTGSDLKVNKSYDGVVGSKTREALEKAAEKDKIKEISRKFWEKRHDYLKSLDNASDNPGWWPRLEEFKE
ncbi:MAG: peptidoglycan-binding protein [Alphaproteobacteria bacterium]|nr:peptidoglycan-binding protein [Alphaproteobacteria bacterium]